MEEEIEETEDDTLEDAKLVEVLETVGCGDGRVVEAEILVAAVEALVVLGAALSRIYPLL